MCACVLSVHLFSAGSNCAELGNAAGRGHAFQNPIATGCPCTHTRWAPVSMGRAEPGSPLQPCAGPLACHHPPVTRYFTPGTAEQLCTVPVSCSAVPPRAGGSLEGSLRAQARDADRGAWEGKDPVCDRSSVSEQRG